MQEIIIIAGPNGAGKTSFANELLPVLRRRFTFVNADEIARELAVSDLRTAILDVQAGREMLTRISDLVESRSDLMFETTLSSRSYARSIREWQQRGYGVAIVYLRLPSAEMSIERVRRRVAQGGHGLPEGTIRRRFAKSLDYFERIYKPIVNEWYVWDSLEGEFRPAEAWDS